MFVWATQAVQLAVDYRQNGSGPVSGGVAVLTIDRGTLREIKE